MIVLLITLIVIVAALLVLVILSQNPKGGLSSQFGGSGTSNLIGVKKTTDLLETITWTLIVVLFVLSMSTNLIDTGANQQFTSPNVERAQDQVVAPSIDLNTDPGITLPVDAESDNTGTDTGSEGEGSLDDLTEDNNQ